MVDDECYAQEWLLRQGHCVKRPSSDPPDYIVDGVYGVEVRRLNQGVIVGNEKDSEGEEEQRIPLTDCVKKAIDHLGPPGNAGWSWVIDCEYDFSRNLPRRKTVRREISEALEPLLQPYDASVVSDMHNKNLNYEKHIAEISHLGFPHLCLKCGLCLDLWEISHEPASFILGNVSDGKGILLDPVLKKSIRYCIQDKSEKVRKKGNIKDYKWWWLILVDHICHVPITAILSEDELSSVRDQQPDFWSRITIINSQYPGWHYDLF